MGFIVFVQWEKKLPAGHVSVVTWDRQCGHAPGGISSWPLDLI